MFECGDCGKAFAAGFQARENHCRSTGHLAPRFECDSCDVYFRTDTARCQHMDAKGHWCDQEDEVFECHICPYLYNEEDDCREHEVNNHYYCADCDRSFQNLNNIKMVISQHYF